MVARCSFAERSKRRKNFGGRAIERIRSQLVIIVLDPARLIGIGSYWRVLVYSCWKHRPKHLPEQRLKVKKHVSDYWNSFSFVGLVAAALLFAASVTPSLLPRTYYFQGVLSGFAISVGYSLGVALILLYQFLELPNPSIRLERSSKVLASILVASVVVVSLRHMAFWQDSIRELMDMPELESVYLYRTAAIALLSGAAMVGGTRLVIRACGMTSRRLNRLLPRRVSIALSSLLVGFLLFLIGNGIVVRGLLSAADSFFLKTDELVEEGIEQPTNDLATGSPNSLIDWKTIGRQGKNFVVAGPNVHQRVPRTRRVGPTASLRWHELCRHAHRTSETGIAGACSCRRIR
jgi:uncharacterized membrane protein